MSDALAVLTTVEFEITTASVAIHTMKVGAKQVTLALFRQLPDLDWKDLDPARDTVWGTVRYEIGVYRQWAVIERGQVLYRVGVESDQHVLHRAGGHVDQNGTPWGHMRELAETCDRAAGRMAFTQAEVMQLLPVAEWLEKQCERTPQLFIAV